MKQFFSFLAMTILFAACGIGGTTIDGDKNVVSKEIEVSAFNSLMVSGSFEIHLVPDVSNKLRIEADSNLLEHIQHRIDNNTLYINPEKDKRLKPSRKILLYVSAPLYKALSVSGDCDLLTESSLLGGEPLSIEASGASHIGMTVSLPRVAVEMSGSNELSLKGQAKEFVLNSSGSCKAECLELNTETSTIEMSGAGEARVAVSHNLSVEASGAAEVYYKGDPEVKKDISGAGKVEKL